MSNALRYKVVDSNLNHFNSEMLLLTHLTITVDFIICRIAYILSAYVWQACTHFTLNGCHLYKFHVSCLSQLNAT